MHYIRLTFILKTTEQSKSSDWHYSMCNIALHFYFYLKGLKKCVVELKHNGQISTFLLPQ